MAAHPPATGGWHWQLRDDVRNAQGKMRRQAISLVFISLILAACSASTPTPEAPTSATTSNVEVFRDLVYAEPLQPDVEGQRLDVYKPARPGTWPVVVFLHGLGGTKEVLRMESSAIAERGAVVFTPTWPTVMEDMAAREDGEGFREMYEALACAIRFARTNAIEHDGEPSRLTLVGHSYGAAYGSWMALAGDNLDHLWMEFAAARGGPPSQVACVASEGSFEVDAFVGIAGRYSFTKKLQESDPELWSIVNPIAHVGRGPMLPVRLLHGERDSTVPPEFSAQMNDLLAEAEYDTRFILYDGTHRLPIDLTGEVLLDLAGE